MYIILASTSKIRSTILKNAGVPFTTEDSKLNEAAAKHSMADRSAKAQAMSLAELKAVRVSQRLPKELVIGADQTLGLGSKAFDKPNSLQETREQLLALRGKTHTLHSALACAIAGKTVWTFCGDAMLTMRNFSESFLDHYLTATADSYACSVGGYKLEEQGINLFEKIEGDYFTILGLPLLPLLSFLRLQKLVMT